MIDQATNGDGDSGRFKILNDWEHDDPAQAPSFKRDQHLTPAALFKAKVLAVLSKERLKWKQGPSALCALDSVFAAIRDIDT